MHIHLPFLPRFLRSVMRQKNRRLKSRRALLLEPLEIRRVMAPLVSALEPASNSHDAPVSASIEATFTENLNPATVNDQTLVVHGMHSGRFSAAGGDTFGAVGAVATVVPGTDLHVGEVVNATATAAIQNGSAEPAVPYVWQFRAGVLTGSGIFDDSGQGLGNSFGQSVSLGDVDGDGDVDAFVANAFLGNVANRVWINQGGSQGGTLGTFAGNGQALGDSHSTGVQLGDLDADGDLDAFVANANNLPNRVWVNEGGAQGGTAGSFSDSGQTLGNYNSQDLSLGDVDGDGDLDAFVANIHPSPLFTQSEVVWLNQGGAQGGTPGTFSDSGQRLGTFPAADVSLGDLDADGDLDAYVANILGQGDRVWINQGGSQSGTMGVFSDSGQRLGNFTSEGVELGDLDGDGDLDAFTSSAFDFIRSNRVWINQGGSQGGTGGTFVDSNQSLGEFRSTDVDLGDVDGDGDLDAFIANANSQPNRVWINQGGLQGGSEGAFVGSGAALGTGYSLGASLADLDNDGDLDAFEANFSGQANRVWFNRNLDFGDAPATFGTTSADDGARHIPLGLTLGSQRDIEANGQPTADATGDDANNTGSADDEDGVVFGTASVGQVGATATVSVAGAAGRLDAWIDFNNDGTFTEGSERIANGLSVAVGDNSVLFNVPADAVGGLPLAARFRLSSAGGLGPLGTAADGEVEDHTLTLVGGAPTVIGQVINDVGIKNRSAVTNLTIQFNSPVTVNSAASLKLFNHTTGTPFDVSAATLEGNGSVAVTWNLAGINLNDGYYTAKLPRTEAVSAGQPLVVTHTFRFHALAGDSTGDASVGFGDFGELAGAFNTVNGQVLGPGDMNGDGSVNFTDFGILAAGFNNSLAVPSMDFGDALELGTSFPTTLPAGARHILGSGLLLGTIVDDEANGQPHVTADGDGADEDGVVFGALQAGTNADVTVTAAVPTAAVINAWIDFNADGDWDDEGEQIFVDRALVHGANALSAAIPSSATPGSAFARFRITSCAGHGYAGLAPDGEVEDYLVTILAAASRRSPSSGVAGLVGPGIGLSTDHPGVFYKTAPKAEASDNGLLASIAAPVYPAAAVAVTRPHSRPSSEAAAALAEDLVDRVFEKDSEPLLGASPFDHPRG